MPIFVRVCRIHHGSRTTAGQSGRQRAGVYVSLRDSGPERRDKAEGNVPQRVAVLAVGPCILTVEVLVVAVLAEIQTA